MSRGSIFVGGTDILITGYENGFQRMSGKGVAAILGYPDDNYYTYNTFVFTIESSKPQTVFVSNSISIPEDFPVYVTTRNSHEKIDILESCLEEGLYYYGGYILLGPKSDIQLNISTDYSTVANLTALGSGVYTVVRDGQEKTLTGVYEHGYILNAVTRSRSYSVYAELKSNGTAWPIEIDGFITGQYYRIYEASDFVLPGTIPGFAIAIIVIVAIIIVVVIVICIVCCSCICCRTQHVASQNDSMGTGETTIVATQYNGPPPQPSYQPQPQPQYYNNPPVYGVQSPSPYANPAQPPMYASPPAYNQTPISPYASPPAYNQPQAPAVQPVYGNPYNDVKSPE
jgi:hypothetical protein